MNPESAGDAPAIDTVLSNGLRVRILPDDSVPIVSCWVGYRVGSRDEFPGITGASHWVEHMTFKRTRTLREGEIFQRTARVGGSNNGFTSDDHTVYYETVPTAHLDLALEIEAERMATACFDVEEFERERGVILAERSGSENSPHFLLWERMLETIFTSHPYRWPIIGRRVDLESMSRDQLFQHYRRWYRPDNAVVTIAGDVDPDRALRQVESRFSDISADATAVHEATREPDQQEERRVEFQMPGPAAYLTVAYRAPAFGTQDWFALAVADALLSGGKSVVTSGGGYVGRSMRLYRRLVDGHLAQSASSSLRIRRDPFLFTASLTLAAGVDPEIAEARLCEEIEGLGSSPPSQQELDRARRQVEAQFAYGREGVTNQAYGALYFSLLGCPEMLESYVPDMLSVTPEAVAEAASRYLRPEGRTVGWFFPEAGGAL